jgi:uncharacterized protein YukJ
MPVPKYGVLKGRILSWKPPDNASHAELQLEAPSGSIITATINVVSQSSESELAYWLDRYYSQSQLLTQLSDLDLGAHTGPRDQVPALDFLRGNPVKLDDVVVVPHDKEGAHDDILDELTKIVSDAVDNRGIAYVFGSFGDDNRYLYNIHMNQGNSGYFQRENGIFQDGGILIEFLDDHWEAIFIAFATQSSATDEGGQPKGPLLRDCHKSSSHIRDTKKGDGDPETNTQNTENVDSDIEIDTQMPESDEYAKDPAGIMHRTKTCQALFEDCQQYPVLCEGDWFDQMSARFNWWSLGIGADKSGHSSLDHRVRTRDDVRNILVSLLDSLTISLRNYINIGMWALAIPAHLFPQLY